MSNLGVYTYQTIVLLITKPSALVRLFKNLGKGKNIVYDDRNYAELLSIWVMLEKTD